MTRTYEVRREFEYVWVCVSIVMSQLVLFSVTVKQKIWFIYSMISGVSGTSQKKLTLNSLVSVTAFIFWSAVLIIHCIM